jgi:hypothetical protein
MRCLVLDLPWDHAGLSHVAAWNYLTVVFGLECDRISCALAISLPIIRRLVFEGSVLIRLRRSNLRCPDRFGHTVKDHDALPAAACG